MEQAQDISAGQDACRRSVPSLQLLAMRAMDEVRACQSTEMETRLKREEQAEVIRLRRAAEAKIARIQSKLAQDLSAAQQAHALKADRERQQLVDEQKAAVATMWPSVEATAEGWVACAGGEACASKLTSAENGVQLFRPDERELHSEGCNGLSCTMHERYCEDCCLYPTWPEHVYIRGEDEEGSHRDLVVCSWCSQFLCPECCKPHEPECKAEHENRCGYERSQCYVSESEIDYGSSISGRADGHCGQPADEVCRDGAEGDDSEDDESPGTCQVVTCGSCSWVCQGFIWSGVDRGEETECEVRLCKRHAPPLVKPRKKPRLGSSSSSNEIAPSEDEEELYCGECDGELPEYSDDDY